MLGYVLHRSSSSVRGVNYLALRAKAWRHAARKSVDTDNRQRTREKSEARARETASIQRVIEFDELSNQRVIESTNYRADQSLSQRVIE